MAVPVARDSSERPMDRSYRAPSDRTSFDPLSFMTPSNAPRHASAFASRALRTVQPILGAAAMALAVASCASTQGSAPVGAMGNVESSFLEASPALARDIEIKALEVSQMRSDDDFIRLSDWFQSVGESAYPKLLEMAQSSDDMQCTFALSVIAARRDARLLEPLREAAPMSSIANQKHRYEMARALLMLGDQSGVPILIDGLESPHPRARAQASKALSRGTNSGIGFNALGTDEERAESVAAWRAWWNGMEQDQLLKR